MDSQSNPIGGVPDDAKSSDQSGAPGVTPAPDPDSNGSSTPAIPVPSEETAAKIEQAMGAPAFPPVNSAAPAAPPQVADPAAGVTQLTSPQIADDNDLIEPEWVDSAKAIVERTHDDPYQQNKEISKLKADYMLKRYKKSIKVTEE